jgi:hypothetical protein
MNYDGLMVAEHTVPADAVIVCLKLCENCAAPFARAHGTSKRYCFHCQMRALAPVELGDYEEMFPGTERQMKTRVPVPKTDHSLDKVYGKDTAHATDAPARAKWQTRTDPDPPKRRMHLMGDWVVELRVALAERGPMSYAQMVEITHHASTQSLLVALRYRRIITTAVASVWPRRSYMGPAPKMYALAWPPEPPETVN